MTELLLVTGGAGRLGRPVLDGLLARGAAVRVLGRRERPAGVPPQAEYVRADLVSGDGLDAALAGVTRVIHLASNPQRPQEDIQAAERLWAASRRADVAHVLCMGIVGTENMQAVPLYAAKLAVERSLAGSALPWSVQRATQFHDFVLDLLRMLTLGPLLLAPAGVSLQPVEAAAVAGRVVDAVLAPAAGRLPDLAGPELCSFTSLARAFRRASGARRSVLTLPLPVPVLRAWQGGRATSAVAERIGLSWERWLAETTASA